MVYLLPTKGKVGYRGKRPNAIRSFSGSSTDKDGARCCHVETNCGDRFTISNDRMEQLQSFQGLLGKQLTDIVKTNSTITAMTQDEYDVWLAKVRASR